MTYTTQLRADRDVEDEWVTVVSPRTRFRTPQDDLNDALAGLHHALLHGSHGYVIIDPTLIPPEDDFDRELAELAALHWDD